MKVLIWDKNIRLRNTGGPSGYLYNIYEYVKTYNLKNIDFYSNHFTIEYKEIKRPKGIIIKIYRYLIKFWIDLYLQYLRSEKLSENELELINSYDFIHVHSIDDMRKYFINRNKINAKIILTSHCPEPLIDEISATSLYRKCLFNCKFIRNFFIKKETEAFDKANFIMFPVENAKEAYTDVSFYYKECFERNSNKIFYTPTAIVDNLSFNDNKVLDSRGVSLSNLKVCFIGRHSIIKGYDKLVNIAENVWSKCDDITFIIGGKKSKIKYPNDKRWIELGWVNTSELLEEIDVFILPNKQTYFDLILLEVLRQGVPVLASNTGGNKWFKNKSRGIFLYDYNDVNSASNYLMKCRDYKKKGILKEIGECNRKLFLEEFTLSHYINTYLSNLQKI